MLRLFLVFMIERLRYERNNTINRWDGGTTFWYMGHSIDIEDDGEFGYEVTDSSSGKTVNIFALVDLIRELGYGPEN